MAKIIKSTGEVVEIKNLTLKVLQEAVGGYIETTPAANNLLLVVNEEGKLQGLPVNPLATSLLQHPESDIIVGDAVLCSFEELEAV